MHGFIGQLVRFMLKLVLGVFALILVASLVTAAVIALVVRKITSLITGKKPEPTMVFGHFQRFSQAGGWPGTASKPAPAGDIVDVEVREIRDDKRLP